MSMQLRNFNLGAAWMQENKLFHLADVRRNDDPFLCLCYHHDEPSETAEIFEANENSNEKHTA